MLPALLAISLSFAGIFGTAPGRVFQPASSTAAAPVPPAPFLVAVGTTAPYALWSDDHGATWTAATAPAGNWSRVTWAKDRFVALGNTNATMFSLDGKTWSSGGNLVQPNLYQTLASSPSGHIVALRIVTPNLLCLSTDGGVTWGSGSTISGDGANNVGWDQAVGQWTAPLSVATTFSTDDGATWSTPTTVTNIGAGANIHAQLALPTYSIMVGTFGNPAVFSTTDGGVTWTPNTFPFVLGPHALAWNGKIGATSLVIALLGNGSTWTSPDGINGWATVGSFPGGFALNDGAISDGTYFIFTDGASIWRSTDAVTWTQFTNAILGINVQCIAAKNDPGVSSWPH